MNLYPISFKGSEAMARHIPKFQGVVVSTGKYVAAIRTKTAAIHHSIMAFECERAASLRVQELQGVI